MTLDEPSDAIRRIWRDEQTPVALPTLEQLRQQSKSTTRRVTARNLREYIAGAILVPVILADIVRGGFNGLTDTGQVVLLAGLGLVMYQLHQHGRSDNIPGTSGLVDGITFYRRELVRQRDLLRNVWRWYLSPLVPGMLLILVGRVLERQGVWPFSIRLAVGVALYALINWLNQRAAMRVQRLIDALDANLAGTQVSWGSPFDPSMFERVCAWGLRSVTFALMPFLAFNAFLFHSAGDGIPRSPQYVGALWATAAVIFCLHAIWFLARRKLNRRDPSVFYD